MFRRVCVAALFLWSHVEGGKLAPIIVRGTRLYNSKTNERFFIRGITYDYDVSDAHYVKSRPILEANLKDIMGSFNTFRLYNVDPTKSYESFMEHMDSLGVYVMVSASPANDEYFGKYRYTTITKELGPDGEAKDGSSVVQKDLTKTCYPAQLLEFGKLIIKDFAKYDNALAVVVANEIMQKDLTAAPCVKAYVSDLKNWMRTNAKKIRILPLAYAGADSGREDKIPGLDADKYTIMKIQGLLCGDRMVGGVMTSSIDIYMINEYRWCNDVTAFAAGYGRFLTLASGVPIVMALGEFGCPKSPPRKWPMVPYMFSDSKASQGFTDVYSGGLAYTFGEASIGEGTGFPLFTGGSKLLTGDPGTVATPDYANLVAQYKANPSVKEMGLWTKDTICSWAPEVTSPILDATAKAISWIPMCTDPKIKALPADKWTTSSRQNAICDGQGNTCEVTIDSAGATTEETLCGKPIVIIEGGGSCKTNVDCGDNGKCMGEENKQSCVCVGCFTGTKCDLWSAEKCDVLTNNSNAPKIIFSIVGGFLGIMTFVFVGLGIVGAKQDSILRSTERAVKAQSNTQ